MSIGEATSLRTSVVPESTTAPAQDPPLAACMGMAACRKICKQLQPDATTDPATYDGALPGEYDCEQPTAVENVPKMARVAMESAVRLPSVDGFSRLESAAEIDAYLRHQETVRQTHETYCMALMQSGTTPRYMISAAADTYEKASSQNFVSTLGTSAGATAEKGVDTDEQRSDLQLLHSVARGMYDARTLKETSLLFDANLRDVMVRAAREIGAGHHIKLVGEPGIAKSRLASYIALLNARAHHPGAPDSELMPAEVSFASTSEAEALMREQTFVEGTLGEKLSVVGEAMKHGTGIVLNEQNGMSADQQTFLNDYFLKKPGDVVRIGSQDIVVQPGFCVIATLNPMTDTQGNRRHGRQQQDSANAKRYARIDLLYPYQEGYVGDSYSTILRLCMAEHANQFGWELPTSDMLLTFRDTAELMSRLTQMATKPKTDATTILAASTGKPDLAECISPRDLGRALESSLPFGSPERAAALLRQSVHDMTLQILHSDNGHVVMPDTKEAVTALLKTHKFTEE